MVNLTVCELHLNLKKNKAKQKILLKVEENFSFFFFQAYPGTINFALVKYLTYCAEACP